jgi:carbon catabolite-derepressing protein kinase
MVQNNVSRAISLTQMTPSVAQPAKHIPPGPETLVPSPDGAQDAAMIGKYVVKRTVGVGTFSKVKLAEDIETGQQVAIKVVPRRYFAPNSFKFVVSNHLPCLSTRLLSSDVMRASWDREIAVLKAITSHPRCISLLDTVEMEDCWCLVMEYVAGGELFDWVAKEQATGGMGLSEDEARRVFAEILDGVSVE